MRETIRLFDLAQHPNGPSKAGVECRADDTESIFRPSGRLLLLKT